MQVIVAGMTVAVMVKVFDGIVLATDSATTLALDNGSAQVYNSADKLFNLHRDLPIAAMCWGRGQIGPASIATLAKTLRSELMGLEPEDTNPIDSTSYTVREVAERASAMLQERINLLEDGGQGGELGLLVAGYGSGSDKSEAWLLVLENKQDDPPAPVCVAEPDAFGWIAYAQPIATQRLFNGIDPIMHGQLLQVLPEEHHEVVKDVLDAHQMQPAVPAMPFPDAIGLAKFLVEVTKGFSHFLPGPDTVGGPIEVAGVNRHEGFKWIERKHYFPQSLNRRP